MHRQKDLVLCLAICLATFLLLIFHIGHIPLFDWDEINFAEISREMIVSNNFLQPQVGFAPFYEKPPLFNWLQVICMKLFGISEFSARLPNVICGVLSVGMIYFFGLKNNNRRFALLWVLSFLGGFLSLIFFKSGIIDPWFNLFIYGGILLFIEGYFKSKREEKYAIHIIFSGIFIGLAVLTKGPVAIILSAVPILLFFFMNRSVLDYPFKLFALWASVFIAVASSWFIYETYSHGFTYLNEFLKYQVRLFSIEDAEHGGFPGYHFIVILIGCFPASILCLKQFKTKLKPDFNSDDIFISINSILLIVVLTIFSIVQTKIIHYSSLAYFPLSYLAANFFSGTLLLNKVQKSLLVGIGLFYALALFALAYFPELKNGVILHTNNINIIEQFSQHIELSSAEKWGTILIAICFIIAIFQFIYSSTLKSIIAVFAAMILIVELFYFVHLPKLERYSQGGIIDFCKGSASDDAFYHTFRMKSYAIYYYTNYQLNDSMASNRTWLIENNNLNKDCYFVAPKKAKPEIDSVFTHYKLVYDERGVVVYKKSKNPL